MSVQGVWPAGQAVFSAIVVAIAPLFSVLSPAEIFPTGHLALTDSGSVPFQFGTRVSLVCATPSEGCAPASPLGSTDTAAQPLPVLQVVVPPWDIVSGSASMTQSPDDSFAVTYSLNSEGQRLWCEYTRHHLGRYAAIVLDNTVLSDPVIEAPICGGESQITGLSSSMAETVVADLNAGKSPKQATARVAAPSSRRTSPINFCGTRLPGTRQQVLCYDPQQIRTAYGIQPLLDHGVTGRGRTIIVLALGDEAKQDAARVDIRASLLRYDRLFGLPAPQFKILAPFGGSVTEPVSQEAVEDIEIAHAVAPGSAIDLLLGNAGNHPFSRHISEEQQYDVVAQAMLQVMRYSVTHDLGDVMTISYNVLPTCVAPSIRHDMHEVFRAARTRGITVLVDAGDGGSLTSTCKTSATGIAGGVDGTAADPFVTSVGGTTLHVQLPTGSYQSETVWNSRGSPHEVRSATHYGIVDEATGGGISGSFRRPSYQDGILGIGSYRGVPDVAFDANPLIGPPLVMVMRVSRHVYIMPAGGTSEGAPAWAGIVALGDQYAQRRLGFINPALYRIGRSTFYHQAFHDVVSGNNTVRVILPSGKLITVKGFDAGRGWDPVTGWGSPNVANLLPLLAQYDKS